MTLITPLSSHEQTELSRLESVISAGIQTWYAVGEALLSIRDERLYRQDYATFEDYCRNRWHMASSRAYQLISGASIRSSLSTIVDTLPLQSESHARALAPLSEDEQALVWRVVSETAPNNKPTAAHIKSVVTVLKEITHTGAIDNGDGEDIPIERATMEHVKAAISEETIERMERQRARLASQRTPLYKLSYETIYKGDGSLSLPDDAMQELDAMKGVRVRVIVIVE